MEWLILIDSCGVFELVIGSFVREEFGCYFVDVGCGVKLYVEIFGLVYYFLVDLCVCVVVEGSFRWVVVVLFGF